MKLRKEDLCCATCKKKAMEEHDIGCGECDTRCINCNKLFCHDHWDGNIRRLEHEEKEFFKDVPDDDWRDYICTMCSRGVKFIYDMESKGVHPEVIANFMDNVEFPETDEDLPAYGKRLCEMWERIDAHSREMENNFKQHTKASEETIDKFLAVARDMLGKGAHRNLVKMYLEDAVNYPTDEELLAYAKRWDENWESAYRYVVQMKLQEKTF